MAHFVRHLPPKWHLVRGESINHKKYREALCEQRAEMEKSRVKTCGLWWPDQRYVDQVVPAQFVNPDFFDTFNYRYQVYARPPPVMVPPRTMAEACDQGVPVSYNVKRLAVDKVWAPGHPICAHHWFKKPWEVACCPPIGRQTVEDCRRETAENCSQNNNTRLNSQPSLIGRFNGMCPRQGQNETVIYNNKGKLGMSDADMLNNQNTSQYHQRFGDASRHNSARNPHISAKQASNYSAATGVSNRRGIVRSKRDESNTVCPCNEVAQDTDTRGVTQENNSNRPRETACMHARVMANRNKVLVKGDTVASLLGNLNNNRRDDLTNDPCRIVTVDNLVGADIEDSSNSLRQPHASFIISQHSHYQPEVYTQDGVMIRLAGSPNFWHNYHLCRNNNAECGNSSDERPGCIPRQCCECSWYTPSPCQCGTPLNKTPRKPGIRTTPCVELLGHLQDRAKPRCFIYPTPKPDDRQSNAVTVETAYDKEMSELGYTTYKIIGGKQYRLPPPKDYTADVKLPRHLEEYQEFTRRCPNPKIGRHDKSDPANEMLLPGHLASNLMKVNRSPFVYLRNPKCYSFSPLFYSLRETEELVWSLPSTVLKPQ